MRKGEEKGRRGRGEEKEEVRRRYMIWAGM